MPQKDTSQIKENIVRIIQSRGPSIPATIAREMELSILFTSAFLSELLSEKQLKISSMRIGSSPLYFIPGQEFFLEKFATSHLKSKEKDAFLLLQERNFLKDSEQEPAIRVALRSVKDFAFAFKYNEEIYWRYFKTPPSEFKPIKPIPKIVPEKVEEEKIVSPKIILEKVEKAPRGIPKSIEQEGKEQVSKELNIFDEEKREPKQIANIPKEIKKKVVRKKNPQKKNEKFFNKVKEFLSQKSIEISGIEGFSKNDLHLRIKSEDKEKLLVAYNKKRINEADLINANKKAVELNLEYDVLCFGEPLKKLDSLIGAIKNLGSLGKIED
jgi:hypothetical protein